ncbi:MAG: hypothetical protein JSS53_09735 [Proteobacteria bacterium]|nr:hypothetical protein [Pseudomonadota bacterium]
MKSHDKESSYLLVFSESLNNVASIKQCVEHHKKSVGLIDVWRAYRSQILIVLPHFPPYSLCVSSVLALADCYETQAMQLADFLHSELGFTRQQIHIESGSVESLVKRYIQKYQIDKVIVDFEYFKENKSLGSEEAALGHFKKNIDSLMSLYRN